MEPIKTRFLSVVWPRSNGVNRDGSECFAVVVLVLVELEDIFAFDATAEVEEARDRGRGLLNTLACRNICIIICLSDCAVCLIL